MSATGILKLISLMLLLMGLNQIFKENRYKSRYPNRGTTAYDSLVIHRMDSLFTTTILK